MAYEYYDYNEIKNRLLESDNIQFVLQDALPDSPVKKGTEWRFGNRKNPHLSVQISGQKKGIWYDHIEKEGGFIVSLIAREMCVSSKDAWEFIGAKLGVIKKTFENKTKYDEFKRKADRERERIQQAQREEAKREALDKQEESLEKVQEIISNSIPISGTIAEEYLLKTRGLEKVLPTGTVWENDYLRFKSGVYHAESNKKYPALIAIARDSAGVAWAAQVTFLDSKTADKIKHYTEEQSSEKKHLSPSKKTYGTLKKINEDGRSESACCFCVLKKGTGTILASEGIENALSFSSVEENHELRAVFGLSNLENCIDYLDAKNARSLVYIEDQDADVFKLNALCDYFEQYKELHNNVVGIRKLLPLLGDKKYEKLSYSLDSELNEITALWKTDIKEKLSAEDSKTFKENLSRLRSIKAVNNIKARALNRFSACNLDVYAMQPNSKESSSIDFNDVLLDPTQGADAIESYYFNKKQLHKSHLRKAPVISTKEKLDSVKNQVSKVGFDFDEIKQFKAYREQLIGIKQAIKHEGKLPYLMETRNTINGKLVDVCSKLIDGYDQYRVRLDESGLELDDIQKWFLKRPTQKKSGSSNAHELKSSPQKNGQPSGNSQDSSSKKIIETGIPNLNSKEQEKEHKEPPKLKTPSQRRAPRIVLKKTQTSPPENKGFFDSLTKLEEEKAALTTKVSLLEKRLEEQEERFANLEKGHQETLSELKVLRERVANFQPAQSSIALDHKDEEKDRNREEAPTNEKPKFGNNNNSKVKKERDEHVIDGMLNQISGYTKNTWTSRDR